MVYTRKNIKNLTGGVSQQPDSERFDNQCSEQKNFLADPIKGLTKRAGTNYVQVIDDGGGNTVLNNAEKNTFTHIINRSSDEQLMLVISHSNDPSTSSGQPYIELYKLNEEDASKEVMTLVASDGSTPVTTDSYLNISSAVDTHPYSAVTIADYTFIANNQITPALKSTTSGGVGMYERTHVKRGLIFIKESAYSSEWTIKATDSEGVVRSARIFTGAGASGSDSLKDIRTSVLAGAIHACLEAKKDSSTGVAFDTGVTHDSQSNAFDTYTEGDSGISMRWEDDSTDHVFNGDGLDYDDGSGIETGGARTAGYSGSNYSNGKITFGTSLPADNNSKREISIDAGSSTKYFAFTGGASATAGATSVAMGTTVLECADNLAAAINADGDLNWSAAVYQIDDEPPYIQIYSTSTGDVSADGNGTMAHADIANVTTSSATGGNASAGSSTASVRNPIHFERFEVKAGAETAGSIISWFASYPDAASANASPIKIEISDSYGDTMTESFTDVIDGLDALPTYAPNNYLLKVEGNQESDVDDYYLKFVSDDENAGSNHFGKGKWEESLNVGLQYQIDPATMPHQLIKVNDTTYKFVEATWNDKAVGDATSDATPSFIGNGIRDIFFYKSRLGVLAGESVIMSEVDNAYNFWRTSVATSIDSDRIDITSSVNEITYLNWAVPFANQLVVFSDRAQFLLTQGNQGLTPSTAALSLGSSYENSTICRPVVNDNSIVFAQEKSGASAVFEMYPTGSTEISFEAKSISEHIPTYISGKITNISASSLANTMVVKTDSGDNTLYVYRYYNQGNKRLQSAWSKYELACNHIKGGHFISDKFHIVEGHHDGSGSTVSNCIWILSYMKFDNTDSLTNSIDLYFNVPSGDVDDSGSDTTLAIEWNIRNNTARKAKIVAFNKSTNASYTVADSGANNVVTLTGVNLADNANIVVGLKFEASYEFSKQYIKRGGRDGKEVAITDGRTTTKWYEIYFNDSQYLKSTVSFPAYANRSSSIKEFNGNPDNTITGVRAGEQPSETSTLRTSVAARSDLPTITLSSDTHQTVTITGAAFELMHTSRLSRTN